jgi:hypothetical protein
MRSVLWVLLLAALVLPGCWNGHVLQPNAGGPPLPAPAAAQPALRPVTADQVNEANAHEVADVLQQELDRSK